MIQRSIRLLNAAGNCVFAARLPSLLPVNGTTSMFPVRRVYCVGQNYASHAREMGNNATKVEPFFFTKPSDSIVQHDSTVAYPPKTASYHHEVELVAAIGVGGSNIAPTEAMKHCYGFAVGLDMTRRDLQAAAKKSSRPWDLAKGADGSAPCGTITRVDELAARGGFFVDNDPGKGIKPTVPITLHIGEQVKQQGTLGEMILTVEQLISILSEFVQLEPGDLVYTGTPEGVGPVNKGETLVGSVGPVQTLKVTVV